MHIELAQKGLLYNVLVEDYDIKAQAGEAYTRQVRPLLRRCAMTVRARCAMPVASAVARLTTRPASSNLSRTRSSKSLGSHHRKQLMARRLVPRRGRRRRSNRSTAWKFAGYEHVEALSAAPIDESRW